jgi:hypothetical protein
MAALRNEVSAGVILTGANFFWVVLSVADMAKHSAFDEECRVYIIFAAFIAMGWLQVQNYHRAGRPKGLLTDAMTARSCREPVGMAAQNSAVLLIFRAGQKRRTVKASQQKLLLQLTPVIVCSFSWIRRFGHNVRPNCWCSADNC